MTPEILTPEILAENFSFLNDWEERYGYVLDLGKGLPPFPETLKTDLTLVRGCTSRVWLVPEETADGTVRFLADSDAHLVRGLIAVLRVVYNGRTPEEIARFPIEDYFAGLGLAEHLSPSRRNGFFAMVERIRALR